MNKTVLLIDDDQHFISELARCCQSAGLDVVTAADAREAVAQMKIRLPELMCVDAMLPATSSCTFLERMSMSDATRDIPAIVFCDGSDRPAQNIDSLIAYHAPKSIHAWPIIEMFIHELIDVCPAESGYRN